MSPNPTLSYMAEQINRGRLDGVAARGWLAEEAAATRSRTARPARVPAVLNAALIRLVARIQRKARPVGTLADPAALTAWSTR